MKLENKVYTQKELAKWFNIKDNSFRHVKDKKLEELKEYADFETITTKTGRLKGIQITNIYCPIYYKGYKEDFLSYLSNPNEWESTLDQGYGNISIIVNYYCELKGIPYKDLGLRSNFIKIDGISLDNKYKISEIKNVRNSENYKQWYYLYDIAKRFFSEKEWIDSKDKVICRTNSYYPISLKVDTKEMKEKAKIIRQKYEENPSNISCIEELMKEGLLPREGFKMRASSL